MMKLLVYPVIACLGILGCVLFHSIPEALSAEINTFPTHDPNLNGIAFAEGIEYANASSRQNGSAGNSLSFSHTIGNGCGDKGSKHYWAI